MPIASARFETANGSKYLQQLCKHFAHKVPVDYSPSRGECRFSCGIASLDADDTSLRIKVDSPDAEQLGQTKHVIDSHLTTFAFREKFQGFAWID